MTEPLFTVSTAYTLSTYRDYNRAVQAANGVYRRIWLSAVIYIAALAGVSPDLHEAATIDGATRLQRIIHINLPAIMPTIVIMLIMAVGGINEKNAAEFLKAGAVGLGVGGNLANRQWIADGAFEKITQTAQALVAAVRTAE